MQEYMAAYENEAPTDQHFYCPAVHGVQRHRKNDGDVVHNMLRLCVLFYRPCIFPIQKSLNALYPHQHGQQQTKKPELLRCTKGK